MAKIGTQNAFESPGVFWLPGSETKLSGQLKYDPDDGPQLSLVGRFDTAHFHNYPVIYGALDDEVCTLFNCNSSRVSSGVIFQTAFEPSFALIGDHVSSLDEAVFDGLKVRFNGLDDWVNHRAFAASPAALHNVVGPSQFSISAQKPIVTSSKELGGSVTLGGQPNGQYWHRKIDWEYHSFFEIDFDKPVSIRQLHSAAFELQHFLSLLTWQCSPVAYLSAFRSTTNLIESPSGKKRSGLYGRWSVSADNQRTSGLMLTALSDISGELPSMISSWFRSSSGVKMARHLLTSIIKSEGQYLEFTFLAVMQTVEALHRSLDSRNYMAQSDYEAVRQILVAAIPKNVDTDHRASLESRIKYGNELSLRTRLKELFLKLPQALQQEIANDWKKFVGKAVDARNALTHPNTESATTKPNSDELSEINQRMKLLLTILLLNEIGLPFDKITVIAREQHWRWHLMG